MATILSWPQCVKNVDGSEDCALNTSKITQIVTNKGQILLRGYHWMTCGIKQGICVIWLSFLYCLVAIIDDACIFCRWMHSTLTCNKTHGCSWKPANTINRVIYSNVLFVLGSSSGFGWMLTTLMMTVSSASHVLGRHCFAATGLLVNRTR